MLHKAIKESADIVQQNVVKHMEPADLAQPKIGQEYNKFSEEIEHLSLGPNIFKLKFWNLDKVIVWTVIQEQVGKQFKENKHLDLAIKGQVTTEIEDSHGLHQKYHDKDDESIEPSKTLELYVPIKVKNSTQPIAVVEAYYNLDPLYDEIAIHKRIYWSRIIVGFALLYVVLFGIVFQASKRINYQNFEIKDMFFQIISTLVNALDTKSSWTKGHSQRTEQYVELIAQEMNIIGEQKQQLMLASMLHDIGKIGTYDSLLDKAGKLTKDEFEMIKLHPVQGVSILENIKQLQNALPIIRHHHERYDGSGYPDGLAGEEIPLMARILTIADCFDAMTADRPYRKALSVEQTIDELDKNKNIQFDPELVDIFIPLLEKLEGKKF